MAIKLSELHWPHTFEGQLVKLSLLPSLPLLGFILAFMVYSDTSLWLIGLVLFGGVLSVGLCSYHIWRRTVFQFRTLSNLLEAIKLGDYTLRASLKKCEGAPYELAEAINDLSQCMMDQRLVSAESQVLVNTIIEQIDVAIIALGPDNAIDFINPKAKKLLSAGTSDTIEQVLKQCAFIQDHTTTGSQIVDVTIGRQQKRLKIHIEQLRKSGLPYRLLFISDVSKLLRQEAYRSWQSLVRVISHEINNSLSPIASISQTMEKSVSRHEDLNLMREDLLFGLNTVAERARSLAHFVESYKQFTRLPEPQKQQLALRPLVERTIGLFPGKRIEVFGHDDVWVYLDPGQIDQVLINIVKNAFEAMSHANSQDCVSISWLKSERHVSLYIRDSGVGVSNMENLFVPFYSTKKDGTGIGLLLCRQIVEAHEGSLSLANNEEAPGCIVHIELPLTSPMGG